MPRRSRPVATRFTRDANFVRVRCTTRTLAIATDEGRRDDGDSVAARVPLLLPVPALALELEDVRRRSRRTHETLQPTDEAEVELARLGEALATAADVLLVERRTR